jgi:tryptophan-rich sensory protein
MLCLDCVFVFRPQHSKALYSYSIRCDARQKKNSFHTNLSRFFFRVPTFHFSIYIFNYPVLGSASDALLFSRRTRTQPASTTMMMLIMAWIMNFLFFHFCVLFFSAAAAVVVVVRSSRFGVTRCSNFTIGMALDVSRWAIVGHRNNNGAVVAIRPPSWIPTMSHLFVVAAPQHQVEQMPVSVFAQSLALIE